MPGWLLQCQPLQAFSCRREDTSDPGWLVCKGFLVLTIIVTMSCLKQTVTKNPCKDSEHCHFRTPASPPLSGICDNKYVETRNNICFIKIYSESLWSSPWWAMHLTLLCVKGGNICPPSQLLRTNCASS